MPVTTLAARILAPPLLESDHLVAAGMLKHLAGNGRAGNGRGAELRGVSTDHQHLAELDDLARLTVHPVDPALVFGGDPVLLPAGLDDCEHLSVLVCDPCARTIPDRLLSVGLLFIFKGLYSPRKS